MEFVVDDKRLGFEICLLDDDPRRCYCLVWVGDNPRFGTGASVWAESRACLVESWEANEEEMKKSAVDALNKIIKGKVEFLSSILTNGAT